MELRQKAAWDVKGARKEFLRERKLADKDKTTTCGRTWETKDLWWHHLPDGLALIPKKSCMRHRFPGIFSEKVHPN